MTWSGLIVFCSVYVLAVATPGPGTLAVVARVLSRGTSGVWAFIAGFLAGDLIWFTLAAAGLTALANTFGAVFVALKYAGAAYLLWMAWRMWTSPAAAVNVDAALDASGESSVRLFLTSLSLTLGNPKVIFFFLALLPTVIDLQNLSLAATVEIWLLMAVILTCVLGLYATAATRARLFFRSSRAMKILNRSAGVVMGGAAAAIMTR